MTDFFRALLNRSLSAGILVPVVLLLRLLLKKAPKWLHCLLWAIVALRLLLPALPESRVSLNPRTEPVPLRPENVTVQTDTGPEQIRTSGGPLAEKAGTLPAPSEPAKQTDALTVLGWVWLGGTCLMLGYAVFSTAKLRRQVSASLRERENVFLCDGIASPFILGIVFPRIYLPSGMEPDTREHVLAHERAHLSRGDQLWKPLGWLLLSVYWFHPLVWLGYVLLCRDIELACDEKVVRKLETPGKAAYSQALLNCSLPRRTVTACPLAFGETGVKTRVKNVLNYRKPALWVILAAVILILAAAVCFLTKPKEEPIFGYRYLPQYFGRWTAEEIPLPSDRVRDVVLDRDGNLFLTVTDGETELLRRAGRLTELRLTKRNYDIRFSSTEDQPPRRTVRRAYRCVFTLPETEALLYADVLELRAGEMRLILGWQDEEGLSDPDSDDSRAWWYAALSRGNKAASAVRPGVAGSVAAILNRSFSGGSVTVTGEIDNLKTFDSLILEPTGELFNEPWEYRIVFDPVSVIRGKEPVEVLFGTESVGIDGWRYVSPNMAGVLEWVEGKFAYFEVDEGEGEVPARKPELRLLGWQEQIGAECVGWSWEGEGVRTVGDDSAYAFLDAAGNRIPLPNLPLSSTAVLKTVVPTGTDRDAWRTVSLYWTERQTMTVKQPDRVTVRYWAEDWETGLLVPTLIPTDGTGFDLADGCHIYEIRAEWDTENGVNWVQYRVDGHYMAFDDSSDGLWRKPPELYVTVLSEDSHSNAQLWQGTYSWQYDYGGIDAGGAEVDAARPSDMMADWPEHIPTVTGSAGDRACVYLYGEGTPLQNITVTCYDPSQWGEMQIEGTQLRLKSDGGFLLPDGEYLYVVSAGWADETYQGSCIYAFYCDSRSAKTGTVERMGPATPETVLEIFSRIPVDEAALCQALRHASEAGPAEAPEAFTTECEIEVYFSGGAAGYTGDDEHLHLRAGAEEDLVEVCFKPRLGRTETRWFRDEALYAIVRSAG